MAALQLMRRHQGAPAITTEVRIYLPTHDRFAHLPARPRRVLAVLILALSVYVFVAGALATRIAARTGPAWWPWVLGPFFAWLGWACVGWGLRVWERRTGRTWARLSWRERWIAKLPHEQRAAAEAHLAWSPWPRPERLPSGIWALGAMACMVLLGLTATMTDLHHGQVVGLMTIATGLAIAAYRSFHARRRTTVTGRGRASAP